MGKLFFGEVGIPDKRKNFNHLGNLPTYVHESLNYTIFFPGNAGVGVGMTRDTATLMVGQYFKRRRELVEVVTVAATGVGVAVMSVFIMEATG